MSMTRYSIEREVNGRWERVAGTSDIRRVKSLALGVWRDDRSSAVRVLDESTGTITDICDVAHDYDCKRLAKIGKAV